jgi:hypothetical protein
MLERAVVVAGRAAAAGKSRIVVGKRRRIADATDCAQASSGHGQDASQTELSASHVGS